jgi:dephospho-CoA kinase
MRTIGIVGGIASGKSEVAAMFGQLGAVVLDADILGHEVLKQPEVRQAALDRWGPLVQAADGALDRSQIAARVFAQTARGYEDRAFWEGIMHPRIRAAVIGRIAEETAKNPAAVIVLDAALLIEAGWDHACQAIVYIDAGDRIRRQRAALRGWREEEFDRREAAQLNLPEKRRRADFVIDNSGSRKQTYGQVLDVWRVFSQHVGPSHNLPASP